MFQYAIGRNLAHINRDKLSLDKSFYNTARSYPFPCHIDKFDITDSKKCESGVPLKESTIQYDSTIEYIKYHGNVVIDGYWQDERYFRTIRSQLVNDLKLRPDYMSDEYHNARDLLAQYAEPVFVHVRRGERVDDHRARSVHGLIDIYYYIRAMRYVKRKLSDVTFFFFSDNSEYAVDIYGRYGIIMKPMNDYEHFSLMCNCKHAIIANSSFSWWAAWLIQNEKKIVVAPSKWTTNPNNSNREIVLKSWKKINPHYGN